MRHMFDAVPSGLDAPYDLVLALIQIKSLGRSSTTLPSFRAALKRHYFQDAFLSQSPRYNW